MDYVSESGVEEILTSVLEERFPEIKSLTEHQKNMAYKTRNKTVNRLECKQLHFNHVVPERSQEESTYTSSKREA